MDHTLQEFEQLVADQSNMVFAHDDVHGFDLATQSTIHRYELNATLGLEDVGVSDIHKYLFRQCFIAQELVDCTIKAYNQWSRR